MTSRQVVWSRPRRESSTARGKGICRGRGVFSAPQRGKRRCVWMMLSFTVAEKNGRSMSPGNPRGTRDIRLTGPHGHAHSGAPSAVLPPPSITPSGF